MLPWLCFCPSPGKDSQVIEVHNDNSSIVFTQHSIICKNKNKKQGHPVLFHLVNLSSAFHCKTAKGKPVTFACIPAIMFVQDVEMASQFLRNNDFNLLAPYRMEILPLKQGLRMLPGEAFIVISPYYFIRLYKGIGFLYWQYKDSGDCGRDKLTT